MENIFCKRHKGILKYGGLRKRGNKCSDRSREILTDRPTVQPTDRPTDRHEGSYGSCTFNKERKEGRVGVKKGY